MRLTSVFPSAAVAVMLTAGAAPIAAAADLGGNCCVDLEERIAELEATTARKGNRKVSLTVAGQVNQTLLYWDDGHESNAYVAGNKNDQSNFSFAGSAEISPGWSAGYELVIRIRDTLSDAVDQSSDDDVSGDGSFQLWQSNWWIESEKLGRFTAGLASRVSDTAPETDLSEAGVAGYAGVQDIGGGFALRRKDGALAAVAQGDVYSHLNGDTANIIRYDSPAFAGFNVAGSWGEDDIWDVGLRYAGEGAGFQLEGAVAYTESSDENGIDGGGDTPNSTVLGSASLLHVPTGLNLTLAAGHRKFDAAVTDADAQLRTPADLKFLYVKLGWIADVNSLGTTAFYGEYGVFKDFVSAGLDADGVSSLSFTDPAAICAGAGQACRVAGNRADVWGLGVVQHIDAAEMQVYLGYRHHAAEFDIVDAEGGHAGTTPIENFHTLIAGSKISF